MRYRRSKFSFFKENKISLLVNIEGANFFFQMQFFTFCHQVLSILTIDANIGSCPRTTLPLPHGFFRISCHFRALRPHASTLEGDLIVFKEEEYHFYMVPCFDYGDPLTANNWGGNVK